MKEESSGDQADEEEINEIVEDIAHEQTFDASNQAPTTTASAPECVEIYSCIFISSVH